jgi:hypothetical protein
MSVGVMKDWKLNLRNLNASHTLGFYSVTTEPRSDLLSDFKIVLEVHPISEKPAIFFS